MNLPPKNFKIKIAHLTFDVIYSEDVGEQGNVYGSCHHARQKIYLSPKYSQQRIEEAFIHEVIHACMDVAGLNKRFEYSKHEYRPTAEETVTELSTVFYQVINDNPKIFT